MLAIRVGEDVQDNVDVKTLFGHHCGRGKMKVIGL
jgi:hypothetical protein